ncbi:VTT domain-containing protein [Candidatus Babeliales bacterium]|nr:VTT domain-containing protein [Candidatus Babeliales bacterium]MCF7899723.1 VTT domain-containing protein [Candidatus Babeliales bacterium]
MKISKIKILIITLLLAVIIIFRFSPIIDYLTFESFIKYKNDFKLLINAHLYISVLLYILAYVISNVFLLPFSALLTIGGGFIFGILFGTIFSNIGSTLGAACSFLIYKYLFGKTLQNKYQDKLTNFNKNLKSNSSYYLLIIRLVPIIPFFIVNILASFTQVSLATFIWTTSLGIIPISIIFTMAGKKIETISKPGDVFSRQMLIILSLIIISALIPMIIKTCKKIKRKRTSY